MKTEHDFTVYQCRILCKALKTFIDNSLDRSEASGLSFSDISTIDNDIDNAEKLSAVFEKMIPFEK